MRGILCYCATTAPSPNHSGRQAFPTSEREQGYCAGNSPSWLPPHDTGTPHCLFYSSITSTLGGHRLILEPAQAWLTTTIGQSWSGQGGWDDQAIPPAPDGWPPI